MAKALETWEHITSNESHTRPKQSLVVDNDPILNKAAYNGDIAQLALAFTGINGVGIEPC